MTSVKRPPITTLGSAALAALLFLVLASGCGSDRKGPIEWSYTGSIMGTYFIVKAIDEERGYEASMQQGRAVDAVDEALDEVDGLMSTYKAESELSRFNASDSAEPFAFSPHTMAVLKWSQQVSEETEGAFDVTVGPLVNAYGFGPDIVQDLPDAETIEGLRERVGYHLLVLDLEAGTAAKRHPELYVDLSGVAKGYAVDRAAEAMEAHGYEHFMVEIGGEVRARGRNAHGSPWRIAVERPGTAGGTAHRIVPLLDLSMATSGDYRNFVMDGDRRLSHIIDPRTGHPADNRLASVTVLHEECALADAYATAFLVLGEEEGYRIANALDLAVYFIYHDGEDFVEKSTPAFEAAVSRGEAAAN